MQKKKGFATISDVAKHANVGKTSVSRYLNGEQNKLSDLMIDKIANAIKTLDYRPNHSARMLKAGQSKLIGLLLADVTNPYSIDVLQGIEDVCRQQGYMLMVCNTNNQQDLQAQYLTLLEAHRVDGLIINTAGMIPKQVALFQKLSCPLVLVDRINTSLGYDSVGLDNHQAVTQACQHLLGESYNALLVITESLEIEPRQARVDAIADFCNQHSTLHYQVFETDNMCVDSISQAIQEFIGHYPQRKKAIFTINGVAMMSTAKALKGLNLQIRQDIGLIGIDDPEWAQLFEGGITVMRQPSKIIGQTACERLLTRIQGNKEAPLNLTLSAELIVREST
ncbi:LacI family DNA-binding transcriptional regulator [Marinomonas posidonica]|uniref:Transcriptional regulator, LacI family n=1 Tax=Marinomonas posidonica (strain CECT 7376 / NCIMB 14433 / IVIA-Po-181) TaxID=491952 RepID=F6D0V2_MARPP|nr:LacI family DNA-binding transcriptional regulator [Marinomonas posidonica]AEF55984.1 transcriptional regulator, LacI family [Marinomonas posidonica IVIA-Po-181]